MAPKKKATPKKTPAKTPAKTPTKTPTVTANEYVDSLANMYRGMGSSQPSYMTNDAKPGIVGGESFGTPDTPGSTPNPENNTVNPPKAINAFDEIGSQLSQWNLGTLADTYISLMTLGFTPSEAMNKLKYDSSTNPATGKSWNDAYNQRFAGNQARIKQGLNAYDESAYLTLENSYADTLRRNNLGNLLSVDPVQNYKKFAGYMEKGLSATEFAGRIDEYTERVVSMDPNIKKQFKAYFPGITDSDIVAYLAEPDNTLPVLKNKITAAEIGASALRVGLAATDKNMALGLAQAGVTAETAQAGYEKIGDYLERTQFLSNVYDESGIQYNQTTAEQEELQGLASAKRKREQLKAMETAAFSGDSGRLRTGQAQRNTGAF